ncbi:MAG: (2E,6E)-farnesyl diphosphate synthase [Gammaproteobacteria bacterium]|nr:(2E,6E)-farnesyl diphosphate synthase [Gammaproteobacteria bacterium]
MQFDEILKSFQARAEAALDSRLPADSTAPGRLHAAMRYATLGGGKRVRPVLVYATGTALGACLEHLDGSAAAVEFIHAYSLIHDDLPAMDNDDLRRGRPTCHRAYDEATAILAGDSLQALAFEVLASGAQDHLPAARRLLMMEALATASGSFGMAGGQAIDLAAVGRQLSLGELENMHLHKTGALIRASVRLGFLASGGTDPRHADRLDRYARCVGLAFQVHDDILDVEGSTEVIGKPRGSDQHRDKPTYPNLLGMDEAKATAQRLCDEALEALSIMDHRADFLRRLAEFIVQRDR